MHQILIVDTLRFIELKFHVNIINCLHKHRLLCRQTSGCHLTRFRDQVSKQAAHTVPQAACQKKQKVEGRALPTLLQGE